MIDSFWLSEQNLKHLCYVMLLEQTLDVSMTGRFLIYVNNFLLPCLREIIVLRKTITLANHTLAFYEVNLKIF